MIGSSAGFTTSPTPCWPARFSARSLELGHPLAQDIREHFLGVVGQLTDGAGELLEPGVDGVKLRHRRLGRCRIGDALERLLGTLHHFGELLADVDVADCQSRRLGFGQGFLGRLRGAGRSPSRGIGSALGRLLRRLGSLLRGLLGLLRGLSSGLGGLLGGLLCPGSRLLGRLLSLLSSPLGGLPAAQR